MSDIYYFEQGRTPLLVSMPHSGTQLPDGFAARLSDAARSLPDTDWHVPRLYDFAGELGASVLQARFSRYVVDLNRPPDDQSLYPGQATTGLCPVTLFDGRALYQDGETPDDAEQAARRAQYWQPYQDRLASELARLRDIHGYALLYDAHSIPSRVPRLFDGRMPDLNLGTANGKSCASARQQAIAEVMASSNYTQVVNGRFVGGYITRHHGRPEQRVHAVQMEIAQVSYMDEVQGHPYNQHKAKALQPVLREILQAFLGRGGA
jgi:N-formylglutamate amidohydrolase